jgi:hypothetical protein
MSGETTLRRIRKMKWHNALYEENARMLGLSELGVSERKKTLFETSAETLVEKLPVVQHWSPALDGRYLTQEVDLGMLSNTKNLVGKPSWCEALAIGDCAHDVWFNCHLDSGTG